MDLRCFIASSLPSVVTLSKTKYLPSPTLPRLTSSRPTLQAPTWHAFVAFNNHLVPRTIDRFLSIIALSKLDAGLYPGVSNLFRQGDATLLNEDLPSIERRLEREDRLRLLTGDSTDAARRAKQPPKAPKGPTPSPAPTPAPTSNPYPPTSKPSIPDISGFVKDTTNCPGCFAKGKGGENCRGRGCYPLAVLGFMLKHSPTEAKKFVDKVRAEANARKEQHPTPKAKQVTDSDAAPPEQPAGAKRATSVEPPDASRPVSYSDAVQPSPAAHNYYDDLASDSDDDLGHFIPDDAETKTKFSSAPYSHARARRAAVSTTFSAIARRELNTIKIAIKSSDEALCCADS